MTNAIQGATLTLLATSDDGADTVQIDSDAEEVISTLLQDLVEAYNAINTPIDTISESDPTLASGMKSIQRSLRNTLTSSDLLSLGIASDGETGALSFDSDTFSPAYA
jgi:flagellar hook-associated protein 2